MRCPRTWWLLLARSEVDLCLKDPGFSVDVVVTADLRTLTRVWMGDVPMAAAVRAGSIRLEGPPALVRAFPTWLRLSSFAHVERVATSAAVR
jgi:putative sterol carrier protein